MTLTRLWGLYTEPSTQWHQVNHQQDSMRYSLLHLALIALIPAISAYASFAYLGWNLGNNNNDTLLFAPQQALSLAIVLYLGVMGGAFALAYLIFWMAHTFGARANFSHSIELATYAATPLFMTGLALLIPKLVVVMAVGLVGLAYSTYLLYCGIPIVMRIPQERSFIYAVSVITGAWVLLLCAIVAAIMAWSWGFMYLG